MSTRRLLAEPRARRYLTGQILSLVGDSAMWLACGIWVKDLTGSDGAAGLTFLFFTAPALLAPLAGLLADRLPRRRLLVAANLAGAAILLPLLAVRGPDQVSLIYAVMLLYGCLHLVIEPAQSALLVTLLPADLLAGANALLRTVRESLRLLAPLAGAGLYALFGGAAVAVLDLATFVGAAALLLTLRGPDPTPERPERTAGVLRHWVGEVGAGFQHLAGQPLLRRVVLATTVLALVLGFAESTGYAVVDRGLHRPPEFLGVLQAAQGLGAVLGGLGSTAAVRRFGEVRVAATAFLAWAAGAALAATPLLGTVLAGRVTAGAGLTVMAIALLTLLQRRTPDRLQGRVYAGFEVTTSVPQTASIALGAYLIGVLDYRVLLLTEAAVVAVAAVLLVGANRYAVPLVRTSTGPDRAGSGHDGGHDDRARAGARRPAGAAPSARP
ncbi:MULTISPECIES: MFS transporter [Micromonospora]|uniref:MFS transporter n=1 Tax=Micromonospora solifontis TaxID=2487138 RepID=A0ABX9WHI9_9ACTN|nr:MULTISPECIES: MFS transporter [Micromonospora]NES12589.1 MFS transporter [Micromonospora sp. PPF5-17B]NES36460.1 MFS transporter [Micromonospora solifontis]NES54526.1 MFS transporter [Micromonospora sp. PPF5-6]RNL99516.1 MFS transporter [Micromonospora solifontis]